LRRNLPPNRTGLNVGHAISRVDPQNPIKAAEFDRNNGAALASRATQCFRDVGAASERYQARIEARGGIDQP
jgi:hypothetical protein